MSPQLLVGRAAQVSEVLEVGTLVTSAIDDKGHVWSEHKWGSVPGDRVGRGGEGRGGEGRGGEGT